MTARYYTSTAIYMVIPSEGGHRYRFLCEDTVTPVCTTSVYASPDPFQTALTAWEKEGRQHFELCPRCGKWIAADSYPAHASHCTLPK